jgi:hypothetical protein
MTDWFERLIKEIIWKALDDFFSDLASKAESEIESYLNGLTADEKIASSPLVKVLAVDSPPGTVTFLVRGRVKLFKGVESAFMRIEVVISKDVDLSGDGPPIDVVDWHTVIGDLKLSKKNVFEANVALGYDNGTWLGRGALKVLPAGFGIDLFLGGLNDRGAMIGLDVDFPAPIPLGSTGVGLSGVGGDFAYNFIARLESAGVPITDPVAKDYVTWARNHEPDRWVAGPIDQTAVGVGIRSDFVTLADSGRVLKLEPIGLAVLTPGPVFILGGVGKLLDTNSAKVEGYLAVDIPSASMALGLGVQIKIPASGSTTLVDAKGVLDAFFSFSDPSLWYVNVGTDKKPISAKVLKDLLRAEIFFMINNNRMHFGAGISIGGEWSWWIITLIARVGARVAALVGWNPVELAGSFKIWGELGIKIWKFKFVLTGAAEAIGHTPEPTQLDFKFSFKLDLPWPIPDVKGEKTFSYSDEDPVGPPLVSPLMVGTSTTGGSSATAPLKLGAIHAITGRQWELGMSDTWPDLEIVVPFNRRATDHTGTAIGPAVSPEIQGGYAVKHDLNTVELYDMVNNAVVPNVKGVWAAGPGGDTARLHLLGRDPFSWLTPHTDTSEHSYETPPRVVEQLFGYGPRETFTKERRFDEMLVKPARKADLITEFQPALPTRVMQCNRFRLRFRTLENDPVHTDLIILFLITTERQKAAFKTSIGGTITAFTIRRLYGDLFLSAAIITPPHAIAEISVMSATKAPLLVYAVRYREARQNITTWQDKTVLVPGQYRITVEGQSIATHPSGLPPSTPVAWRVQQVFGVKYPETLRPYIRHTTLGDSRIFFEEDLPWNPIMLGFGFPVYKQYRGLVRFLVPYINQIFSTIKLRLAYEDGPTLNQAITPVANPHGESSTLPISEAWVTDAGGTTPPDQEIVFTTAFPQHGAAQVFLLFDHPGGTEVKLDEWTCYISQFETFTQHLDWTSRCLQVTYDTAGRTAHPCCPAITTGRRGAHTKFRRSGNRIDTVFERSLPLKKAAVSLGPLLEVAYPIDDLLPYPDELTSPPVSWRLSTVMAQQIRPLDETAGVRFGRFARLTGARFNEGPGDKLNGINDTVSDTTVEAVVDSQGRPYALWVRTPEPVDWRRVSASLRIRHVKQTGDCPTGYAHRRPLDLDISLLPSPDASSAFLVGSLAGLSTRLPRGEYALTLAFDPYLTDLHKLRPTPAVGTVPEVVKMKFIQPFGLDWPLPSSGIIIPGHLLEILAKLYRIDPEILIKIYEGPLPRETLFSERVPIPRPPPDPRAAEVLEEVHPLNHRLDAAHRTLVSVEAELEEIKSRLTAIANARVLEENVDSGEVLTIEGEGPIEESPETESGGETPGPENEEGGS